MALNKLKYNSLNVTPVANKAISFDSDPDALEATLSGGSMTFIKKLTASSDSTLSFVDGSSSVVLDSTYKEYMFIFKDIHPSNSTVGFYFNGSADTGSNYNVAKTTTYFLSRHAEDGSSNELSYKTGLDLAQDTGFQALSVDQINDNDSSMCGILHLFNPSSTTFVKHFICRTQQMQVDDSMENYSAGYFNTTSAVDAIQFKYSAGNIDAGTITLYGIN
jgi:hypothetical protein